LEAWYRDQNITPQRVLEFGTLETILQSVVAGLGITFVPRSAVAHLLDRGKIRSYSLPDAYSKIKTVFIRRADAYLTSTMEKFIETIEMHRHVKVDPLTIAMDHGGMQEKSRIERGML
jgi:DNA-binding transcriptional LysR family regulator